MSQIRIIIPPNHFIWSTDNAAPLMQKKKGGGEGRGREGRKKKKKKKE